MPSIARKLLIIAAIDGLVIQPLASKPQRPPTPIQVRYGDGALSSVTRDLAADLEKSSSSFEAFGIVGMITVSKLPFLITVTRRRQVAQIRGYSVYVATGVTITPCSAYKEAEESVAKTHEDLESSSASLTPNESDSESESEVETPPLDEVEDVPSPISEQREPPGISNGAPTNGVESEIAKNVIERKGSYGRFATRWFSRRGWMLEQKRSLGMSVNTSSDPMDDEEAAQDSNSNKTPNATDSGNESSDDKPVPQPTSLLPKLLRTASILFGSSQSFYFSYEWDLTRSLASQDGSDGETELHKRADPLYFWNQNVLKPFIKAGHDSLVLPMIQGFVGQKPFAIDSQPPQTDELGANSVELNQLSPPGSPPNERASLDLRPSEKRFLVTLISRRSVKRTGLRYLRRGIDENGYVANAVETEQLLSSPCWGQTDGSKTYSFLQFRGSIPLYFTQSPYSLKPVPVLQHSENANFRAFRKHMSWMARHFGEVQLVNLVEKKRVEKEIGEAYRDIVDKLNKLQGQNQIPFEWFDFHAACRGMKFENVGMLLDTLASKLEEFGSTVEVRRQLVQTQKGVMRTNCMDCLDRTNVVQSSLGKYMLERQLREEGFDVGEQRDPHMMWYNALWADNGDAVSKQYASTAAMKGDYTRTRKRDYRGTLTDVGLSLTRFYNGIVNDDFSQAAIDFLLGNVTSLVFEEFEASLKTKDPAISMEKMREQAIDMCQRQLAGEGEDFISGWTLLAPEPNSYSPVSSTPLEEVVLMVTDAALYICRFDWKMDKISSFERVDLAHIVGIRTGTYISSTLTAKQMDEAGNVGLVIEYKPGKNDVKRVNTRSLSSLPGTEEEGPNSSHLSPADRPEFTGPTGLAGLIAAAVSPSKPEIEDEETKKIPLKAPYSQSSAAKDAPIVSLTENELVETICAEIERLAIKSGGGREGRNPHKGFLTKADIVSLSDAKKSMGVFDQLGYSIKKLLWA
ncbi:hypothetical protein MKZ38_010536 [Zalerion maritima]|uniref:Uncharacterized protein n=1 Tax=Zalerion maritima TaxID=339359 RepID=A0AAD5RTV0_9PEZI|nr:hypothetical protein MKZ38_010536 [Zalerion maritima]